MKFTRVFAFLALAGMAGSAFATNGYFSHGYGMKAKGMAGAATTSTDDAFFGANNPAAAAFAGNRIDLGVDLFSPRREASLAGQPAVESDSNYFLIPEFGYNYMLNNELALGVSVYGNGGMNTDYPAGPSGVNMFGGSGALGVDLMQLIIAPTAAYKIAPNHSLGISPLLGYQRFKAEGLQAFGVNNPGTDDSWGYGVRVGYLGKITPTVSIGAAYASKMSFDEFSKYANLFAEQGGFDIPENYNVGLGWQATPELRLAFDYQRINYNKVNSVGNSPNRFVSTGAPGASNAPGFGWDNINVWKLGAEYKYSQQWMFRAGYSHTDSPIKGADAAGCMANSEDCGEVMMNVLAPAVVEDHVTLGFTYTLASGNELTMAYMHAFDNKVSGVNPVALGMSGGTMIVNDTIKMYEDSIGIQYSWKM